MTIKEVSEQYSLSKDTLRYYEKEGLIGPVLKGSNGQREYQEENLRQIEFVKCMRSINIPISELKKYMDLYALGDEWIVNTFLDNFYKDNPKRYATGVW